MADRSASEIGAGLNVLKDAAGKVGHSGPAGPRSAGPAAAVLGVLRNNVSANHHRPEERGRRRGCAFQPVEGSHSNRLRVRVTPAPAQTQTMVVAPMHKNNDVEVAATAPDRAGGARPSPSTTRAEPGTAGVTGIARVE